MHGLVDEAERPVAAPRRWVLLALAASLALVTVACLGGAGLPPPSGQGAATHRSGPIALSPDGHSVWVVNPDADSVTRLDTRTMQADPPIPVGQEPWAVAVAPDGLVVVANRASGSISLLRGGQRSDLPVGAEPSGLALSPDGRHAYLTLAGEPRLLRVDLASGQVAADATLSGPAAAVVVVPSEAQGEGHRLLVAHLLARPLPGGGPHLNDGMQGVLSLVSADLGDVRELSIEPFAFGFANLLSGIDARAGRAWVAHSLNAPQPPLSFNRTVSAAVSALPLDPLGVEPDVRLDLNDPTFSTPVNVPAAIALTADGLRAYLVLAGSDQLMGLALDDPASPRLLGFWPTGANPRGLAISADGRTAYVMNYLSRDVSVLDLSDPRNRTGGRRIGVVQETLDPEQWLGKRLFHHAADPRMSTLGWISCASCHPGGGSDGTTWSLPEGPRQTSPLWRSGLTGPPFHASATRDELQDVQGDIEMLMRGLGFTSGASHPLLGAPNGGRAADLDALAAFVLGGIRVPAAPEGSDAAAALRGRLVYAAAGCAACHGGQGWTRNALPGAPGEVAGPGGQQVEAVLHDVGTFLPDQPGLGELGFKVPTLLGLHATAPYLHNGAAADLRAVLANPAHAGVLSETEVSDLVSFLLSIDETTPIFE